MQTINFSLMNFIEHNTNAGRLAFDTPTFESFEKFNEENGKYYYYEKDTFYEVTIEKHIEYIWLYFDHGNPSPRDENLTNVRTGSKKENLRKIDEVELTKQLFALYHFGKKIMFLSNTRKKKVVEGFLRKEIGKDFIIKHFLKTSAL